jgi:hypothetical protein
MNSQNQVLTENKLKSQAEEEIAELKKNFAKDITTQEILGLEQVMATLNLKKEDEKEIYQKLHELKMRLEAEYYAAFTDDQEAMLEALKKIQRAYDIFGSAVMSISNSIHERRMAQIDQEEERLAEHYDREMQMVGDNDERKKEIEKENARRQADLERRRIKEMRRAAIWEKTLAAIQAAINTAVAVTKLLGTPPLAIAAGIAGAIQVASILAKPIPQYEDGGITSQREIIAGEAGTEAYRTPGGRWGLTPDKATKMELPVGTRIYNHDDTMRMFSNPQMLEVLGSRRDVERVLGKKMDDVKRAIENKPVAMSNVTEQGIFNLLLRGYQRSNYFRNYYK